MALVRKKNRVLTINDNAVESYLRRGYDQINETGEVVKQATAGKVITVEQYNKLAEELETVKKENASLKGQITKLKNADKK